MMLKKVTVGQALKRFPGNTFNTMVDAVARFQQNPPGAPPPPPKSLSGFNITVRVHNATSEQLGLYAVVALGDPISTPVSETESTEANDNELLRPLFAAAAPVEGEDEETFVIVQGSLDADDGDGDGVGIGTAVYAGFSWVRLDVTSEDHTYATILDDETEKLVSTAIAGRCSIFWKEEAGDTEGSESEPRECWALILLGSTGSGANSTRIIKATGAIAAAVDSMGTRTPGTGSGDLIKGSGTASDLENWSTIEISSGSYMIVTDIAGDPVIIDAWC